MEFSCVDAAGAALHSEKIGLKDLAPSRKKAVGTYRRAAPGYKTARTTVMDAE